MLTNTTIFFKEWQHLLKSQLGALIITIPLGGIVIMLAMFALKFSTSDIFSIQNILIALSINFIMGLLMHYSITIKNL